VTGQADVIEEIARIYGYDRIPETPMADQLPPQIGNALLEKEERVRDRLVVEGLQEIISYRFTTPGREARRIPVDAAPDDKPYVRLVNPISADKAVMRHSVLASVLETAEHNARIRERLALFEIGPVFSRWRREICRTNSSGSPYYWPGRAACRPGRAPTVVAWISST